jgi:hypothetical protein
MKDTPLPAIGDEFIIRGVTYIIAAGYTPASWASGHAKLSLVDFNARTIRLVAVFLDRTGQWVFRTEIFKRKFK